jgi:hypothetical protein
MERGSVQWKALSPLLGQVSLIGKGNYGDVDDCWEVLIGLGAELGAVAVCLLPNFTSFAPHALVRGTTSGQ